MPTTTARNTIYIYAERKRERETRRPSTPAKALRWKIPVSLFLVIRHTWHIIIIFLHNVTKTIKHNICVVCIHFTRTLYDRNIFLSQFKIYSIHVNSNSNSSTLITIELN